MRRVLFIVVSIVVSGIFLWLALRDVNLAEVWEQIRQADGVWLLLGVGFTVGALATRAVRWRGLTGFKLPLLDSFHIINITFLANQLPLRAGEVARSILTTRADVPLFTAATGVVVERLIDTLLVVLLLVVGLSGVPDIPPGVAQTATLFGIAAVIGFAVLLFFARYRVVAHRVLAFVLRILPFLKRLPLERWLDHVLDGLQPLTDMRQFAFVISWTLIAWVFSLLAMFALMRALTITGVDEPVAVILSISLASFSIAIPVSVASVGPFEAAVLVAGDLVGMSTVEASALGLLAHGVTIVVYGALGVIGLLAMGVSLSDVLGGDKEKREETVSPETEHA